MPPALIGKRIMILESPSGKAGVSSMGNVVDLSGSTTGARVIGWCEVGSVKEYTNQSDFEADEKLHLVTPDSGYGWKKDKTKVVYGWVVSDCGRIQDGEDAGMYISATRRMRSLFQLRVKEQEAPKPNGSTKDKRKGQAKNRKRKKRRY